MFRQDAAAAEARTVTAAPLVSIIIDNHNYARFIERSIRSALAQDYPHTEVIVVDDASTDDSPAIIAGFAERVVAVLLTDNRGQAGAFNAGYRVSRGRIVMFMDADDWLYPGAVRRVVEDWVPGTAKAHFRLDLVAGDGSPVDVHPPLEVRLDSGDVRPQLYRFGRYETVVTSGNAFARETLEPNMPIPEAPFRIAADGYLATVVPFHGPVIAIEDRLGAYRMHGGNAYAGAMDHESLARLRERVRRRLAHDREKDIVLHAKAAAAGHPVIGEPFQNDALHLELRLASLCLGPASHPVAQDRRWPLAWRGMRASRHLSLPPLRRALAAAWFLAVGFLPLPLAARLVAWKMAPALRPAPIDAAFKRLRKLLR